MEEFLRKYGSRKFLIAMLTNVLCIATLLGGYGGKIGLIGSIVAIVVNSAIYMINERKIDVEAVNKVIKLSVDDFNEIKKLVNEYKENEKSKTN